MLKLGLMIFEKKKTKKNLRLEKEDIQKFPSNFHLLSFIFILYVSDTNSNSCGKYFCNIFQFITLPR